MALRGRGGRRSSSAADNSGSSNNTGSDNTGSDNASSGNVTNTNVNTGVTTNVTNTNPTTGDTTNVTFGGPDPRGNLPTYNPNIIGAYFGYYNPDYAPSPSTITTPSAVGDVPSTPFPATEISGDVSSGYSPIGSNPSNNFFSGIGSGISNLASNFNIGNVVGSAIGNAIFPGIGGLLGGYIGNTYGDDDPSNNFFGNLGENLKTDFGDTVDFFSPDVKAIDPSLDTSGLTTADLTGSEITNTVDPVNQIGLGTLYGPSVTDISYQDPNALPDNPMYGPDELQRMAGGSSYGLPGSDYTSPTAPSENAVQRPTIADVTNKPTPSSMPMSYGDLNIFQSGPVQGLTLTNEEDQINKEAMTELIQNVVEDFDGAKPYFQDPNSTFRTITPGEMYEIGAPSNEVSSYMDYDQAIADARARAARGVIGGYYMRGYNVDEDGNPSFDTDQSTRNMLYGPQEKPVFDYGNNISLVNNPSDAYGLAQAALEEAFHYDSANSPMPNTLGEFDYGYNSGVVPGASYSFDEGEETMIKEMLGSQNDLAFLKAVGYPNVTIGAEVQPSIDGTPSDYGFNLTPQQYASFLDQFGFNQKKPGASFFNQGGLVPPTSGPMSNGIGVLYKNK